MRFIRHSAEDAPECLKNPAGRRYNELRKHEVDEIRKALVKVQQGRCAYCERRVGPKPNDGHIEHLWRQTTFLELQLDWVNLHWSCSDENSCGKHKDPLLEKKFGCGTKRELEHAYMEMVVHLSKDNPEKYLQFVGDGTVRPREGIPAADVERARQTIELLNLNSSNLVKLRESVLSSILKAFKRLEKYSFDEAFEYANEELQNLDHKEFPTAITHSLSFIVCP